MSKSYRVIINGLCVGVLKTNNPQPQIRPASHVTAKCVCGGNLSVSKVILSPLAYDSG